MADRGLSETNWAVEDFLVAAEQTGALLEVPGLVQGWTDPSALDGFSVGELAGHFVRAVGVTNAVVARGPVSEPTTDLVDYYVVATSTWRDRTSEIRANAAVEAAAGPKLLVRRWRDAVDEAHELLSERPPSKVRTSAGVVLTLNDYLVSRAIELLVHADDLAASLQVECPPPPGRLVRAVNDLLISVARRRHGESAILRALTRRERDGIGALRVI